MCVCVVCCDGVLCLLTLPMFAVLYVSVNKIASVSGHEILCDDRSWSEQCHHQSWVCFGFAGWLMRVCAVIKCHLLYVIFSSS